MATAADIKNGLTFEMNGKLFTVIWFQHVKPGKGPAFVKSKLRNIETGKVIDKTFSSVSESLNLIRIERHPYQFLYAEGETMFFMHRESFEQIEVHQDYVDNYDLFKEGQECEAIIYTDKDQVIGVELPAFIVMEVTYTEPGHKGDTASSNVLKPATVETGAEIKVPLFIEIGTKIKIDTRERAYHERVK